MERLTELSEAFSVFGQSNAGFEYLMENGPEFIRALYNQVAGHVKGIERHWLYTIKSDKLLKIMSPPLTQKKNTIISYESNFRQYWQNTLTKMLNLIRTLHGFDRQPKLMCLEHLRNVFTVRVIHSTVRAYCMLIQSSQNSKCQ